VASCVCRDFELGLRSRFHHLCRAVSVLLSLLNVETAIQPIQPIQIYISGLHPPPWISIDDRPLLQNLSLQLLISISVDCLNSSSFHGIQQSSHKPLYHKVLTRRLLPHTWSRLAGRAAPESLLSSSSEDLSIDPSLRHQNSYRSRVCRHTQSPWQS
jgi:hypothetical protein